jgi:hypothetical protein
MEVNVISPEERAKSKAKAICGVDSPGKLLFATIGQNALTSPHFYPKKIVY